MSRSATVIRPWLPIVAIKANASITPPNCARTLLAESTTVRSAPSARVPIIAKQSSAPITAPTTAETAESQNELKIKTEEGQIKLKIRMKEIGLEREKWVAESRRENRRVGIFE